MLFEELTRTGDLLTAADGVAREFRDRFGFPPLEQVGVVVPDAVEAALALEKQGYGPFFIAGGRPAMWRERGRDRDFSGRLGLAFYKHLEIELLEAGEGSDFYAKDMDPQGRPRVQHLSFAVQDVDEWTSKLGAAGYDTYIRGKLKLGPINTDFAYLDTAADAGVILEVSCWRLFGKPSGIRTPIFKAAARFQKLTGIRSFSV